MHQRLLSVYTVIRPSQIYRFFDNTNVAPRKFVVVVNARLKIISKTQKLFVVIVAYFFPKKVYIDIYSSKNAPQNQNNNLFPKSFLSI